jgi:ribosomal protein S18 acetylase RimI-like enzyme
VTSREEGAALGARVAPVVISNGSLWGGDRGTLAVLLYEGYAKKAATLRVDKDKALALLAGALNLDRCFVAARAGAVVGIVGLVEGRARSLEFPFVLVHRHFGALRSLAYVLLLSIRHRGRPAAGEIVFEALAVAPRERNRGIGTRLVERVEAYARGMGYRSISLEVTDTNHDAIRLYSRLGYAIVETRRHWLVPRQAGFSANHRMRKRL